MNKQTETNKQYMQALRAAALNVVKKTREQTKHKKQYVQALKASKQSYKNIGFKAALQACNNSNNINADEITQLATAVAVSVVKKVLQVTQDKVLQAIYADLVTDTHGGDADDLIQVAAVAILQQVRRMQAAGDKIDLESVYIKKTLRKRTLIISGNNKLNYISKDTSGIQEIFRAVRSYINSNKHRYQISNFSYLQAVAKDTQEVYYYRLPKYADLGGYVRDYNGKSTFYTVSDNATDDIARVKQIIDTLKLTATQTEVLRCRLQGLSYREIAARRGTSATAVLKTVRQIQAKAININFCPPELK